MSARQSRALSQRLLLVPESLETALLSVKCQVLGSTGSEYTVTISDEPTCGCMDFRMNHQICKHIYFVLSRVLRLEDSIWRKGTGFTPEELKTILEVGNHHSPPPEVLVVQHRRDIKDQVECPICMEDLDEKEDLVYCSQTCGYNFHQLCFTRCKQQTCPMCRSAMSAPSKKRARVEEPLYSELPRTVIFYGDQDCCSRKLLRDDQEIRKFYEAAHSVTFIPETGETSITVLFDSKRVFESQRSTNSRSFML
jgi:hypothetical protein